MGTNVDVILVNPNVLVDYGKLEELARNHDIEGIRKWNERAEELLTSNTVHIGKRSGGWKFLFNHNHWKYYDHTRESIDAFLRGCYEIRDEYGDSLTIEQFWSDYVDSNKNGLDNRTYCELEIERAKQKERGEIEDKFDLISSVADAIAQKERYRYSNYYMEVYDKDGEVLPSNMDYFFSDSTDFC